MSVKILVVDDHEIVRRGIRMILQACSDWEIVGEAENGADAIRLAGELQPDAIIMDISMPVMNGLEAATQITKLNKDSKVLIFTMHESDTLGDSVRRTGARGVVVKSRASQELVQALERLLAGEQFVDLRKPAN